ncbi:MAG: FKBP-type peptidyl-prolyl cis-trans isomerase [Opitutales bacterium]
MSLKPLTFCGLILSFGILGLTAQDPEAAPAAPPAATQPPAAAPAETGNPELAEVIGRFLAEVSGLQQLQFGPEARATITAGFADALTGASPDMDVAEQFDPARQFMQDRFNAIGAGSDLAEASPATYRAIGFMTANFSGLNNLPFSDAEQAALRRGFEDEMARATPSPAIEERLDAIGPFLEARKQQAIDQVIADNQAEADAHFATLTDDPDVRKDPTGFYFKVVEPGTGEPPTREDTVRVHYEGRLVDGTVFDSSYDRGEPADFPLNRVVPGFAGGLTKIAPGGKVIIHIPAELGYGNNPRPGGAIEPGDALIFTCELIAVNP